MKNTVIRFICIIAAIAVVLGLLYFYPFSDSPETGAEVETPVQATETSAEVPTTQALRDYSAFTGRVRDLVGYLQVSNTTIDDAVVQGTDNSYYLRRSIYGYYSYSGCYFVDYECDLSKPSQNTVIYGHNLMDSSRLFGQLTRYKRLSFYKSTPVITFDTLQKQMKWKVFAVFQTNNDEDDGVLFNFRRADFFSQEDFLYFIERVRRRTLLNIPVDVQENDRILTLVTCDYDINNDWRLVVMARLIRPGESEEVDVESATVNSNPLYPEGWYRRKGGTRPSYPDEP